MQNENYPKWILKSVVEKKFLQSHPWVFSNDLNHSPKGISAGQIVDLYAESGLFLARGYANPNTLISMRVLMRNEMKEVDAEFFADAFNKAYQKRRWAGLTHSSFRLVYAESDYLPGLIIDLFWVAKDEQKLAVFVIQCSTAGMDRLQDTIVKGLQNFAQKHMELDWKQAAVLFANDSRSREMESLKPVPKFVFKDFEVENSPQDFSKLKVLIMDAQNRNQNIELFVDFLGGQKTGFFLDQRSNVQNLVETLKQFEFSGENDPRKQLRVLDLCSYNGQWSVQLFRALKTRGLNLKMSVADASEKALKLAEQNLILNGAQESEYELLKLDVLKSLNELPDQSYDIVVCDPPAFIKKKTDLITGEKAYVKLNREAMRKLSAQALFISCSCSGLLDDELFRKVLVQAMAKSERKVFWYRKLGHAPDHPVLPEFPQGSYLKSWLGYTSLM